MTQAVSEITEAIGADRSRAAHFGVYGQSWGAALALETAAALIESPELVGLIVASAAPPFPAPLSPPQTRAEARAYITALGGVAQEIQENDELMSLVLEIVEHDFQLARGYVRSPLPKSAPPLLALRGEQDRALSRADFKKWDKFTTRATLSEIPGNHFLLSNPEGIASELARFLARQTFLGDDADGGRASASPARSHGS